MKYSGFLRRFFAMCIDGLIICLPGVAAGVALPYVGAMVISFLYYVVFECSVIQATPGKYIMGMRVVSEEGLPLTFTRAMIRYFMKFVSGFLMGLGYFVQLFTAKRQALHDIAASALVVDYRWDSTPDWVSAWLNQMKFILGSNDSPAVSSDDAAKKILKLQDLLKQGLITEQEFLDRKSDVLTEMLKK